MNDRDPSYHKGDKRNLIQRYSRINCRINTTPQEHFYGLHQRHSVLDTSFWIKPGTYTSKTWKLISINVSAKEQQNLLSKRMSCAAQLFLQSSYNSNWVRDILATPVPSSSPPRFSPSTTIVRYGSRKVCDLQVATVKDNITSGGNRTIWCLCTCVTLSLLKKIA